MQSLHELLQLSYSLSAWIAEKCLDCWEVPGLLRTAWTAEKSQILLQLLRTARYCFNCWEEPDIASTAEKSQILLQLLRTTRYCFNRWLREQPDIGIILLDSLSVWTAENCQTVPTTLTTLTTPTTLTIQTILKLPQQLTANCRELPDSTSTTEKCKEGRPNDRLIYRLIRLNIIEYYWILLNFMELYWSEFTHSHFMPEIRFQRDSDLTGSFNKAYQVFLSLGNGITGIKWEVWIHFNWIDQ